MDQSKNDPKYANRLAKLSKEFDIHVKCSIATLQQERVLFLTEENTLKRELHLTLDDFVSLFQMPFMDIDELPAWKQQELKKKCKLF